MQTATPPLYDRVAYERGDPSPSDELNFRLIARHRLLKRPMCRRTMGFGKGARRLMRLWGMRAHIFKGRHSGAPYSRRGLVSRGLYGADLAVATLAGGRPSLYPPRDLVPAGRAFHTPARRPGDPPSVYRWAPARRARGSGFACAAGDFPRISALRSYGRAYRG